jgi:hypothetical protein
VKEGFIPITFYTTTDIKGKLQKKTNTTGATQTWIINKALEEYLREPILIGQPFNDQENK